MATQTPRFHPACQGAQGNGAEAIASALTWSNGARYGGVRQRIRTMASRSTATQARGQSVVVEIPDRRLEQGCEQQGDSDWIDDRMVGD